MADRWQIRLLGSLEARRGSWVVARFATQKTAALLAFLTLRAGRPQARDALVEMLWPDGEPDLGRNSLSAALSRLRQQLEPPGVPPGSVLVADRTHVSIDAGAVETDVAAFEAALAAGDPARAAALYEGDLLPDLAVEWIFPERDRLRAAFLDAAHAALGRPEVAGEPARALALARRAAAADPIDERARRDLMRLQSGAGEAGAALREYRSLERALAAEVGVAPGPATRDLARAIEAEAARPAGNLPAELTHFFGRGDEIAEVERAIASEGARLVTIAGPGGMGKTRLAVAAARGLAAHFMGAVRFVPLADVSDARLLPGAILASLGGGALEPEGDPLERAVAALARGQTLLVLDNFEHLVDDGAATVKAILERAGPAACLVTSRRPLGLAGERVLSLAPLPVPEPVPEPGRDAPAPDALARVPSVALLLDRTRAARPGFAATRENAAALAALVRRLEGIPLALALAAGRLQVLSPAQLLARLEADPDILAGRARDVPPRHRSLRAAIEWSVSLLGAPAQRFFALLGVLRGGFTVEAAEAVTGDPLTLDRLADLRECSLLAVEEGAAAGRPRFRMLETIRERAEPRLSPEDRAAARERHALHFLAVAEAADVRGPAQGEALAMLAADEANILAALDACAEGAAGPASGEAGLRLCVALARYWSRRAQIGAGRRLVLRALERAPREPSALRARALAVAASLALRQSDLPAAHALHDECLAIRRRLGDPREIVASLHNVGVLALGADDFRRARDALTEAAAIRRTLGPEERPRLAGTIASLATIAGVSGGYDEACALGAEALAIARAAGDGDLTGQVLTTLGGVAFEAGDPAAARRHLEEAIALLDAGGVRRTAAFARTELGRAVAADDRARGRALIAEGIRRLEEIGDEGSAGEGRVWLARIEAAGGEAARALGLLRGSLRALLAGGQRRSTAEALETLASLLAGRHEAALAAELLGAAAAAREALGTPVPPCDRAAVAAARDACRSALGEPEHAAATAAGGALTLEGAVERALGSRAVSDPGTPASASARAP